MTIEHAKKRKIISGEKKASKFAVIERLADILLKKRTEAIEGRAACGVETRWRQDQDAFDGVDDTNRAYRMIDYATQEATPPNNNQEPRRSKVVVNIVRSKCELAEGRFADILLPVDDRNWGLKVTPVPELVWDLKDTRPAVKVDGSPLINPQTGQQATNAEVARAKLEKAQDKMHLMEQEINDQLTECNYNGECRKVLRDAIRLGTGILKGPNVIKKLKKAWILHTDGERCVHVLEIKEDMRPASKRVDPWNVYPDPNCGDDIKRADYIWERDFILPREIRQLMGVEGYFKKQLLKVLEEEPIRTQVSLDKHNNFTVYSEPIEKGRAYEKWEYYGDISREYLEALEIDIPESKANSMSLSGCVVFINDRPVKVILNPLDTEDLPYDFFQWTTVNDSVWGIGIPRILIWTSRVITAAWRAMMDNAGDSAGANIVISNDIEPDDGKWEIAGRKIWRALGETEDVRKAFAQFQVANNQAQFENIIKLALEFVDMETSLPMIFQGEKGKVPETLGATNIMVDANNVALRPRVKLWDDNITRPHLTRYYDWNMQYNPRSDIKGDFSVDARGTSELLEKNQRAQMLIPIIKLREDPFFAGLIDWSKAIRQLLAAQKLDIMKSQEEIKQWEMEQQQQKQQGPPQDPRIQGNIDVATIRAEAERQKLEMEQQFEREVLAFKERMAEKDRQNKLDLARINYEIKLMELSGQRDISIDKIKAELARDAVKVNLQRELSKQPGGGEQVLEPPSEPPQRAETGHAFEQ